MLVSNDVCKRKVKVRKHGIRKEVKVKVKLRENFEAKHPFVVLREDQLPKRYCTRSNIKSKW